MRAAIMDIGSNAIRAVIYETDDIGAPEIFNSKFKSDIFTLLEEPNFDVKHQIYLSIQYLLHIFEKLEVTNIKCVATAVLREHPRAKEFVKFIKNKFNFTIDVISGKEEARLTAMGLVSGIRHSNGIAADLGGGSLELVEVSNTQIGRLESLELGTRVISDRNLDKQELITEIIKKEYGEYQYDNLYLIGGALRFIGRIYIDFMRYPLKNLHNLEISSEDFLYYLSKLPDSFEQTQNVVEKRKINNNAVLVARSMVEVFKPKSIIVSTYGLKEGVRSQCMNSYHEKKDLVIEKVKYTCNYNKENTDFDSYTEVISPLISGEKDLGVIMELAIMLLKLKRRFDKTLKPTAMYEFIFASEIPFTHKIRVKLALIFAYSSNFKPDAALVNISRQIITKNENNNAQIIGHFLSIAEEIDGPVFTTPSFSIKMQNNFLEIISQGILPRPIFEKVCHRLKSIAYIRKMNSNCPQ
jgi:exopolyphosphatase / guanosine-5'-triphosphate,3'-diphosphate pyrophosphatase